MRRSTPYTRCRKPRDLTIETAEVAVSIGGRMVTIAGLRTDVELRRWFEDWLERREMEERKARVRERFGAGVGVSA